jgi:signal transduction histidine kinase
MTAVLILIAVSAVFQFVAAFMAIRLIRVSGALIAWILLAGAFVVMGIRRLVTISHILKGQASGDMTAELLALLISLLIFCGISLIGPLFARIKRSRDELSKIHQELVQSELRYRELNETLEQRIEQAVDELSQKNRLLVIQSRAAVMGEMISNIAHQWRQPLNTLGLLAQELQIVYRTGGVSQEFVEANVKKTMEVIRHMSATIDDFRNFFNPGTQKEEFKAREVLEKSISLLYAGLSEQCIRTEIDATGDPVIYGYPNEFSQVILNILSNARDAFVAGKVSDPVVSFKVFSEGGKTVVTVTDNAGGIPEQIIDKIFEPYFTTKGPLQGTGIGLFMSKTIIEKNMGGRLTVHNSGDGAVFRIEV